MIPLFFLAQIFMASPWDELSPSEREILANASSSFEQCIDRTVPLSSIPDTPAKSDAEAIARMDLVGDAIRKCANERERAEGNALKILPRKMAGIPEGERARAVAMYFDRVEDAKIRNALAGGDGQQSTQKKE